MTKINVQDWDSEMPKKPSSSHNFGPIQPTDDAAVRSAGPRGGRRRMNSGGPVSRGGRGGSGRLRGVEPVAMRSAPYTQGNRQQPDQSPVEVWNMCTTCRILQN